MIGKLTSGSQAEQAPATELGEAQAKKKKRRLLDRLGSTRDAFKTILDFGRAASEVRMIYCVLKYSA